MNNDNLYVLSFSHAKRALVVGSKEQLRLQAYGQQLGDYQVIVFTTKADGFTSVVSLPGITLYPTNTKTKIGALIKAYVLGRNIKQRLADRSWVLISQDPFESSFVARRLLKRGSDVHHVEFHGDLFGVPKAQQTWLDRVRRYYARLLIKRVDSFRVVSRRIKDSLVQRGVAAEKITVLPILSSVEQFLPIGASRVHSDTLPVKLLFVGRLEAEKNLPLTLEAVAAVKQQGAEVELTIVGEGSLRATLEALTTKLNLEDTIKFVGWQEDLIQYYEAADVFVFASDHEGWGMVLIEAMAAGLPIVTTDVGCVGEAVIPVEHALVANVGDKEAFTASLRRLVGDSVLRESLGKAGYRQAKQIAEDATDYTKEWVEIVRQAQGKQGIL